MRDTAELYHEIIMRGLALAQGGESVRGLAADVAQFLEGAVAG